MKKLIFILLLTGSVFGQTTMVTEKFKAEWRIIAGVKPIDTREYDRVSHISVGADRKRYVRTLSPNDQLTVWQVHIAYCLANFTYTPEQEKLVRESGKFFKVELFAGTEDLKTRAAMEDWYTRIREAFKADGVLYRYTFEIPGDVEVVSVCPLKSAAPRTIKASFVKMVYDCNCTWNGGCESGSVCTGQDCTQVINCGVFGWFKCTGLCGQDIWIQ